MHPNAELRQASPRPRTSPAKEDVTNILLLAASHGCAKIFSQNKTNKIFISPIVQALAMSMLAAVAPISQEAALASSCSCITVLVPRSLQKSSEPCGAMRCMQLEFGSHALTA